MRRLLPSTVLSLLLVSCGSATGPTTELADATGGHSAPAGIVAGVRVHASAEWPGEAAVRDQVTPVRVTIENGSGNPLRIRYVDFALFSPAGERYNALPAQPVHAGSDRPTVIDGTPAVEKPAFSASGFTVAPFLADIYPTLRPFEGPFPFDRSYHGRYYPHLRELRLPSNDVMPHLLPEGVLQSGGRLIGFLLFQRVPTITPRVLFRADLENARDDSRLGMVITALRLR